MAGQSCCVSRAVLILAALTACLRAWRQHIVPQQPKGFPIAALFDGKTRSLVGLSVPLPNGMPLPESGRVVGAEVYPPQPPYGASASIMVRFDQSAERFISSYRTRLDHAGYSLRQQSVLLKRTPLDPSLEDAYEADEKHGDHTIYIAIRGAPAGHFAQLTFWSPPSPRL